MDEKSALLNQLRIDRGDPKPSRGRPMLWAAFGVVAAVAAAAGAWAILAPHGVPVHAAIAKAAAAEGPQAGGSLLDATGYVVARRQSSTSSNVIDKVTAVLVEEGDHVQQGQLVAKLDDTLYRAALDQALAGVKQAQAMLAAANVAAADALPVYQRNVTQVGQGLISQATFDAAKATYDATLVQVDVSKQNLAVAQAALAVAQSNENYTTIRAPFAGVVTMKNAQPGDIVSPSFSGGGGIAEIVDMDSLEVQVDVSENFINRVQVGQPAVIRLDAYPDWEIPATVLAIIPTADQTKATVKVRVAFRTKDSRILPQMGAHVSFEAAATAGGAPASRGVIVPPEAVEANGETGTVYVINDDVVERRVVSLGAKTADGQTILSGVQPGASLAVGDLSKLSDGAKVRVEK